MAGRMSRASRKRKEAEPPLPLSRDWRSDLPHSAVHIDFHAGDVRRVFGSQERHRAGHFLRLAQPLHGHLGNDFLCEFIDGFFGSPVFPKMGVTIGPGATVFTRIPRPTSSAAAVL